MDQDDRNTIARFDKLKQFFADQSAIVVTVEVLALTVASFLGLLALLPKGTTEGAEGEAQPGASTGGVTSGGLEAITEDKTKLRTALSKLLVPLMAALKLYFKAQGNAERAGEMDLRRPGDLPTLGLSKYTTLVALVRQYADELAPDTLKGYNQPKEKVEAFGKAADAFGIKKNAPTNYIDQRKNAGERLDDQLDDVREFINDDLKTAVNLLAESHPEFVKGFRQANKTDDRKGKRQEKKKNKTGNTPPAPEAPAGS